MAAPSKIDDSPGEGCHFHNWLAETTTHFKKLSDEERNMTLDYLISFSGANQLFHLHNSLETLLYRDFLRLLPPELSEYLLLFLDTKALLVACSVSRTWNRIVTGSTSSWQRACESIGLMINKQVNMTDGFFWKSYFMEMSYRQHQMKNGSCFEEQIYDRQLRTVTAVYYYKGRLATASDNKRVQLWDCKTDQCLVTLRTEASVSSIKFDDRILVVSSYLGHLMSWDIDTGQRMVEYLRHVGAIFSFDYSEELDVIVSGSADTKIKVWSLHRGNLLATLEGHSFWVLKVILRPLPRKADNDFHHRHVLFSMDKGGIVVWALTFGTKHGAPEGLYISSLYNIPIQSTCNVTTTSPDYLLFTPGLHFDGTFLYFVRQDNSQRLPMLCKWNIHNRKMEKETELNIKVKLFMGIGRKYAAFLTPYRHKPNFVALDVHSLKEVALAHLPPSRPATPDCAQITMGNDDWLNGLNGHNDTGVLFAAGLDDKTVYILKWNERINI